MRPSRGGHAMERTISHLDMLRCGISLQPMSARPLNENSPILGLCQLLPPAPDIGLPMLPPPRAMNRLMQCSKIPSFNNIIPSFDNIVGAGDKHRRNLSQAERAQQVPQSSGTLLK